MTVTRVNGASAYGTVAAPASKSAAHRAIICAALAQGESIITPAVMSKDIEATCSAVKALGARVDVDGDKIIISGEHIFSNRDAVLDCGESGSTLRFMIPVAAAGRVNAEFTGHGRLPERPIGIYLDCLPKHGVQCVTKGGLPLKTNGKLTAGRYEIAGNISSQFITGLLLALPMAEGDSDIVLTTGLESSDYIDMTVQMQKRFGVSIQRNEYGWHIDGNSRYMPRNTAVEGDWSQAAFFMAMGAIAGEVTVEGVRMDSLQGDKQCAELFERFGAEVTIGENSVTVKKGELHGIEIDARNIPDLVPILSVTAALAKGKTVISGAQRLRIKESDRLESTANMINAIGGKAVQTEDGLIIEGVESFAGGTVDGCNDHRIVMSACAAAMRSKGTVEISDPFAINKSFPNFYEAYNSLGGNAHVINVG